MATDIAARGLAAIGAQGGPPQFKAAQRVLRGAQRGLTSITAVLGTAPTYTQATPSTGASTLNPAATTPFVTSGSIPVTDPRVTAFGGPWGVIADVRRRIQGWSAPAIRLHPHGGGIGFAFYGSAFDFSADFYGQQWCCYITDPLTGTRLRTQANDYASTTGISFHKLDFGSAALRIVEIYGLSTNTVFGAINLAASGATLYPLRGADQPSIGLLGDSWVAGALDGGTNATKLATTDFLGAALGCANPYAPGVGGTGAIATSSGSQLAFGARLSAGDFDRARIGDLDLLWIWNSLNDFNVAGNTPAATQTALIDVLRKARLAQPNAVLIVSGPELTPASQIPQAWFDLCAAAVRAVGDADTLYLDNSPAGENWLFGTSSTGINAAAFTGNVNHPNDVGKQLYGHRAAASAVAALRARYG